MAVPVLLTRRCVAVAAALAAFSLAGCGERDESSSGDPTGQRAIFVLGMEAGLDPELGAEIAEGIANVERVSATYAKRVDVGYRDKEISAVVFVDDQMLPRAEMSGRRVWPLDRGEYITASDAAGRSRVAVIGGPVRDHLFGADTALGEDIVVGGKRFRVKGVLGPHPPFEDVEPSDPDWLANQVATRLYLPFPGGVEVLFDGAESPFSLQVIVNDASRIDETASAIETLLAERHGEGRLAVEILPVPAPHWAPA